MSRSNAKTLTKKNANAFPNDDAISQDGDAIVERALKIAEIARRAKEIDQKIKKITYFLTAVLNENADKKKSIYCSVVFVDQTKREKNKEKAQLLKFLSSPEDAIASEVASPTKDNPQIDDEGYEIYEEELPEQLIAAMMMQQKSGIILPFLPFSIQTKRMIKKDSNIDFVDVAELSEPDIIEVILYILTKLRNEKTKLLETMKQMNNAPLNA